MFELEGKVALVTGGGRGLGRGMALALAKAGADIALTSRTYSQLEGVVHEVEEMGRRGFAVASDVRDFSSVEKAVQETLAHLGRLDVLLTAAGVNLRSPSLEIMEEVWATVIDTHLKGAFFSCKAAAKVMASQGGGKIINIGSLTSTIGLAGRAPYTAAKSGVLGLTRALAIEWAHLNIQVNAIGPGYFRTELTEPLFRNEEWASRLLARIPAGRAGLPEDLAGVTVLLASSASDYITGQIFYVDGGYLAGDPGM